MLGILFWVQCVKMFQTILINTLIKYILWDLLLLLLWIHLMDFRRIWICNVEAMNDILIFIYMLFQEDNDWIFADLFSKCNFDYLLFRPYLYYMLLKSNKSWYCVFKAIYIHIVVNYRFLFHKKSIWILLSKNGRFTKVHNYLF